MPKTNTNKYLVVDADNCSGCRICELICSMVKFGEYNPQKSIEDGIKMFVDWFKEYYH